MFNQPVKVTIFGQGFADPVAVGLAGIAAQVLSTSGTEIQVLSGIPAVSACADITGPVHVTNINNGDSGDGPTFTYLVPKPSIFNVAPGSGGQNGGTKLTITGSFVDPGAEQVLIGQQAAFPTPGSTSTPTMLVVTTPPFTGTFPTQPCIGQGGLTGTMNVGQSESITVTDAVTTCTTTIAGAFTYEPNDVSCHVTPPAVTASFTATPSKTSNTVVFLDTSTGGVPPLTYAWDFGGASDATPATKTQKNPTVTYAAPGTYAVTLTVTDSIGTTGSTSQVVTVPAP